MGKKSSVSILFFVITSFTVISVSADSTVCDESSESFQPNSPYDENRRLVISTIPSNVTDHHGYFSGLVGQSPDRVYVMGMCAPGAEPDVCYNCIETAYKNLVQSCFYQKNAFFWFGEEILCLVHYSSKSFLGVVALRPYYNLNNYKDIAKKNQKEFDSVWDGLMVRMITRASSSNFSILSASSKYYAKDVALVPVYGKILTLMQCTPDISSNDCKVCLQSSVDYYKTEFHGKQGFIMLRPSCFFRWELYTFSGTSDGLRLLAPPPPSPPLPPPPSPSLPPPGPPSLAKLSNIPKKDSRFSQEIIALIVILILLSMTAIAIGVAICKKRKQKVEMELPTESVQFDLKTIEAATNNFSESNKLGAGGFGEVYKLFIFKGILMNGTEVAVKRLSKTSGQGEVEFKNEVIVVAKLQHINLVRLLGFSLQREEKLLVYEFVPNKSLDYFLFDPQKRIQLDWTMRRDIISGITRGILYLHQDSRLKIIHRDLKASNILLDADMNPKIADFGMARIFGMDQTVANTSRVVGTFGYMAPEYVTHGQFSTKSDVYSFGVLVLEIISGKKNSSFYQPDGEVNNLVTYVWRLWENKSLLELVDSDMRKDYESDEVSRYIHIGLLCVQENPTDRPTMSTIHQMLTTSSIALPVPLPPGFFFRNKSKSKTLGRGSEQGQSGSKSITCSVDEATITDVTPR